MKRAGYPVFKELGRSLNALYDAALRELPFDPLDAQPRFAADKRRLVDGCLEWQGRVAKAYGHEDSLSRKFTKGSVLERLFEPLLSKRDDALRSQEAARLIDVLVEIDDRLIRPSGNLIGARGLEPLSKVSLAECIEPLGFQLYRGDERSSPLSEYALDQILNESSVPEVGPPLPDAKEAPQNTASEEWRSMLEYLRHQVLWARALALELVGACTTAVKNWEKRTLPRIRVRVSNGRCVVTTSQAGIERGPEKLSHETSAFLNELLHSKSWSAASTPDIKNDLCSKVPVLRPHIHAVPRKRGSVKKGDGVAAGDKVHYELAAVLRGRVKLIGAKRQSPGKRGR